MTLEQTKYTETPARDKNLLKTLCYKLSIYGKPGLEFSIADGTSFILNSRGFFEMEFETPLDKLYITSGTVDANIPLIIDEVGEVANS